LTAVEGKNLFSYTVRPDREDKNRSTDVFDLNAYTVRTLSPDLKAEKDGLYDRWLEAKAMREARESNVGCITELLADLPALLIFWLGDFGAELLHDTFWPAPIFMIGLICLCLYFWLLFDKLKAVIYRFYHRLYVKKHPETAVDEKALDPRLSETVAAARAELEIPDHAWELDILPYRHGVTSVGEAYEIRPRNTYDNIPVSVWREGQALFLSDEDVVMRLTLSEIEEIKRIKGRVKFKSWYKSAAPSEKPYNEAKILEGFSAYACLGKIELTLRDGSYLLIPGYEAETLRHILGEGYSF
jgi:hypothetical protein